MGQRERGAVDGGQPGPRHLLRADRSLLLLALAPAALAFLGERLVFTRGDLELRAYATPVALAAAAAVVLGPLLGTGRRPLARPLAAAAGYAAMLVPTGLHMGLSAGAALAAGIALGGFLLLAAGIAAASARAAGSPAAGVAIGAAFSMLLLATFHVGDPLLEWRPGAHSPAVLTALHLANPLCGAVGDALGIDWLRLPIMYSGFPGSGRGALSAAQYYAYSYPPWWGTALLHGVPGTALLLLARRRFPVPAGRRDS